MALYYLHLVHQQDDHSYIDAATVSSLCWSALSLLLNKGKLYLVVSFLLGTCFTIISSTCFLNITQFSFTVLWGNSEIMFSLNSSDFASISSHCALRKQFTSLVFYL